MNDFQSLSSRQGREYERHVREVLTIRGWSIPAIPSDDPDDPEPFSCSTHSTPRATESADGAL